MPTNLPYKKNTEMTTIKNEKYILIENLVTIVMTVALVLGLAFAFHSWHCMWGLLLMVNVSSNRASDNDSN